MLSYYTQREPWMSEAACRDEDPELFFPSGPKDTATIAEAKRVCAGCPVLARCRARTLRLRIPNGVYGGMDEWEREEIFKRRRATAKATKAAATSLAN